MLGYISFALSKDKPGDGRQGETIVAKPTEQGIDKVKTILIPNIYRNSLFYLTFE